MRLNNENIETIEDHFGVTDIIDILLLRSYLLNEGMSREEWNSIIDTVKVENVDEYNTMINYKLDDNITDLHILKRIEFQMRNKCNNNISEILLEKLNSYKEILMKDEMSEQGETLFKCEEHLCEK